MAKPILYLLFVVLSISGVAQTTNIVLLDSVEIQNLRKLIQQNNSVKLLYERIKYDADSGLENAPNPLDSIYYEGLLNTNPKRVQTEKSFADIDYVVDLIYTSYGVEDPKYAQKAKEIIVSWAKTYVPTGNPINENKFNAFYWGFYVFKNQFTEEEKILLEKWLLEIAEMQMSRKHTPNNNWEAKRCKIIGNIGCILKNEKLVDYSSEHFKKYISTSYYSDGTSHDLKQRDALSYHISGLKPCVSAFINLSKFDSRFELFNWESESGSSVKKSVEFVVPYATGEKKREEWRNTKVKLDKERAAAGLAEYQPGLLFEPKKAYSLFELAYFYNPDWSLIFEKEEHTSSWIGILNGSSVRLKN